MGALAMHDRGAECSVLGALLQDPGTLHYVQQLRRDDFLLPAHGEIYEAIAQLRAQGVPADLVTVDEALSQRGTLAGVGGAAYLVELTQQVPTTANTGAYVDIVRGHGDRRRALGVLRQAQARLEGGMDPLGEIALDAVEGLRRVQTVKHPWTGMDEVIRQSVEAVERRAAGQDGRIRTGLARVDRLFFGFEKKELTIIGARPSVGKSSLAQWIAGQAAAGGVQVGFISLEMSPVQYGLRTLAAVSGVALSSLRDGEMTQAEYARYAEAIAPSAAMGVKYAFSTRNVEDVCQMARRMADRDGLGLVIVDYLQLVDSLRRFENTNARVAYVSRTLKGLAMGLDVPVIAVAQLSRAARLRADKRPVMTDLRDSGALEQDADNVLLMHEVAGDEEELAAEDAARARALEAKGGRLVSIRVLKQRQGECFETFVGFFPERMRFCDV